MTIRFPRKLADDCMIYLIYELKPAQHSDSYTHTLIADLFTVAKLENQHRCLSTDE